MYNSHVISDVCVFFFSLAIVLTISFTSPFTHLEPSILTEYERKQSNALNENKSQKNCVFQKNGKWTFSATHFAIAIARYMSAAPGWRLWLMQVYHVVLGVAYKLLSFIIVAICFNAIALFSVTFQIIALFEQGFGRCTRFSFTWINKARSTFFLATGIGFCVHRILD